MTGLEGLRARKVELMKELARGGVRGVLAVEREIRAALRDVPEHLADEPLTEEDVKLWYESRFWKFASTMPTNPHSYTIKDWGDGPMFERVCLYIWDNGYANMFGGREFVQLDVGDHFYWTTQAGVENRDVSLTTLINTKPLSLLERRPPMSRWRPTKGLRARAAVGRLEVSEVLELRGTEVVIERLDGDRYRWTNGARSLELDADAAVSRLAGRKTQELDGVRFGPATQPALSETDEKEDG